MSGKLHANVKPGDCIRVGTATIHVVGFTSTNRIKLMIIAPLETPVSYAKSYVRKVPR